MNEVFQVNIASESDNKEAIMGSVDIQEDENAAINLEAFRTMTKNKTDVMQNLISMTIESFIQYKEEYKILIGNKDQKQVGLLTHKLKLTSNLLAATDLEDSIKEVREILAAGVEDHLLLHEATLKILKEFDRCILELQIALAELKAIS